MILMYACSAHPVLTTPGKEHIPGTKGEADGMVSRDPGTWLFSGSHTKYSVCPPVRLSTSTFLLGKWGSRIQSEVWCLNEKCSPKTRDGTVGGGRRTFRTEPCWGKYVTGVGFQSSRPHSTHSAPTLLPRNKGAVSSQPPLLTPAAVWYPPGHYETSLWNCKINSSFCKLLFGHGMSWQWQESNWYK